MHKLGSFRKNWLQRWFVLNEGTLQYYGAESDTKPKKLVVLNEACKFGPSTEHVGGQADPLPDSHLQPCLLASGKANMSLMRIPITIENCVHVPNVPRRIGGASSPR